MTWTRKQLEGYFAAIEGQARNCSVLSNKDNTMFIPAIPLPWFKAAMEATKGRGGAAISAVWLESKLQSREPFTIRKSITDKLGYSKRGRQTMIDHLKMMHRAGLLELVTVGKKYPQVKLLKVQP